MSETRSLGLSTAHDAVKVTGTVPDYPDQISYSQWPTTKRIRDIIRHGCPRPGLSLEVNLWRLRNQWTLWRGLLPILLARITRQHRIYGALFLDVVRADGTHVAFGLASLEMVTTVGADYLTNAWVTGTYAATALKYHGIGTTSTAPAIGDTGLGTELGSTLSVANNRATGALTASSHNVVQSVGTLTIASGTPAVVEAGLFSYVLTTDTASQATGKILFDHFTFSAINLAANDGITTTIQITLPPGS